MALEYIQLEVFWNDFEIIDLIVECLQIFFSKEMGGFNFINFLFSELTEWQGFSSLLIIYEANRNMKISVTCVRGDSF